MKLIFVNINIGFTYNCSIMSHIYVKMNANYMYPNMNTFIVMYV